MLIESHYVRTRPEEVSASYVQAIKQHLDDLLASKTDRMLEISDFAESLCVHPIHLSTTIKTITNLSACGVLQLEICRVGRKLVANTDKSMTEIALLLDFDPSQFTKWFKRMVGITPKQFRAQVRENAIVQILNLDLLKS